jgi:ABC-type molybdenum transport system ATPase subunit/photorepair protein PhrA
MCKLSEQPILNNINWTIKKGEFWHIKDLMGLVKVPYFP